MYFQIKNICGNVGKLNKKEKNTQLFLNLEFVITIFFLDLDMDS